MNINRDESHHETPNMSEETNTYVDPPISTDNK